MKQRKKRPVPPPPPAVMDEETIQNMQEEDQGQMPDQSQMHELDDPVYRQRHALAQQLQLQSAAEGYVLLKNSGILPLAPGTGVNVFGRHGKQFFTAELCEKYGLRLNEPLLSYYDHFRTRDAGYTGSGYDEETGEYVPQCRTATGMFGNVGYLDQEPIIGHDIWDLDGSLRVEQVPQTLLEQAKLFSNTAAVVLYRHGGEGADHEKGDERLSEGEASMLSFCTAHFEKVVVILAANSVIDGDFLAESMEYRFYMYTYGGGVYSNNIGNEILPDLDSRVELRYQNAQGQPEPHIYPICADKLGGVFYTCNNPGDNGAEALAQLLTGQENPSGRMMDEIVYDYDDNPVSRCFGGLTFARESTTEDRYIYGHNYVAYKEGVYLGYRYFETFCPERVVYPFGFGLSYTTFAWHTDALTIGQNRYGELEFSTRVQVENTGTAAGKDVVELYVTAPYDPDSRYHLEKPLVVLAAFEKTGLLQPGQAETLTLNWNARDIACYSDTAECYVLEAGHYRFCVAADAGQAHRAPAAVLTWENGEDICFTHDEVTGTPYRNLFTGSARDGWRFDAAGTEKEHIVYLHRIDVDGVPTVAPGTYPKTVLRDEHTRETDQVLDLETRGLSSYYEMDGTDVHLYDSDIPCPKTNARYFDEKGNQRNFTLQGVNNFLNRAYHPDYHNLDALRRQTGIAAEVWNEKTEAQVWDYFLDQLSVNEMLCRFYHSGFDIPSLMEYGIPEVYSADTPGQIGANNKMPMGTTTKYCDTILACTFNKPLCYQLGLALAQEAAASGENGTSYFYAPGGNLHRSCLSGKNNNYFSEDAHLAGWICGYFLKGLEEGGVNGCLKHFACNDQEVSREGLVVFSNEQALRELYFAAFEHALKIGSGQGIMTSLGRVGTVNACGNGNLTVELLRKEWGFDGMVITDGYGVTSYMYEINDLLGANSGLLCFANSGNLGACGDYMELYRYYLQYPGRTTAALRNFMKGCMHSLLQSHTFRELYQDYDYYASEDAAYTTDIGWFDAQIGLGYIYEQAETLTYRGVKLQPGEENPPSMMPNTNCKDRSGTIAADDYGLRRQVLRGMPGERLRIPVSMQKCAGVSMLGLAIDFDPEAFQFEEIETTDSILTACGYSQTVQLTETGVEITFQTLGDVCSKPCGTLFELVLSVKRQAKTGTYTLRLRPIVDAEGNALLLDKQGHEMSFTESSQVERYQLGGGWSGVYQSVDSAEWWQKETEDAEDDSLADLTLLSAQVTICGAE